MKAMKEETAMDKEKNFEKGSTEYYKDLCYKADINLRYKTWDCFENELAVAVKNSDFPRIKNIFYHETKLRMLPLWEPGTDHGYQMWRLLDLLACDEFDNIYRVYPEGLPLCSNNHPLWTNSTNLLLCIMYNTEEKEIYNQSKVIEKAEKFITSKKPVWDRAVAACMLAILNHDAAAFSENIQKVCESYNKTDVSDYQKLFCQNACGLLVLAKHFLTEEEFQQVKYPVYKNFHKGYMDWFFSQESLSDELCFDYEEPYEEFTKILKRPVAITRINQPYLGSDNPYISSKAKKDWYMDMKKMLEEFCTELSNGK